MKCLKKCLYLCVLSGASLAVPPTSSHAQEADIAPVSSDRPSQGISPDLVPSGSLQFENGTNITAQRHQFVADLPETLVRYGVSKHVEVRFLTSNTVYRSLSAAADPVFETQDIVAGTKIGLSSKQALAPKTAVFYVGVPTGGKDMTSGSYDPGLALIWAQSTHGYTFLEEAQATLTTLQAGRRPLWSPSLWGGRSLSPSVGFFVEYAPSIMPDNTLTHIVDGGFTLTRGRLKQFDVRTGYVKDANGLHTLISLGYSIRRDHLFRSSRTF